MANAAILDTDPDVLWIRLRTALSEGRLDDAVEAQHRLADVGIIVRIDALEVRRRRDGKVQP